MKPPTNWGTPRLDLRPPVIDDADNLFATYTQDPEVTRYLVWRPHESIETTRAFVCRCIDAWESGASFPWVMLRREDGQLLGMIEIRVNLFRAELGYVLARRFWGQGYMTEAVRALVDWAVAQPQIHRVWAVCDVDNLASARVMEKAGMQREGLLRRWIVHPNISPDPRDVWCYARVK
jgi:ribosomal-protein-alanine N-acetyltransferase